MREGEKGERGFRERDLWGVGSEVKDLVCEVNRRVLWGVSGAVPAMVELRKQRETETERGEEE